MNTTRGEYTFIVIIHRLLYLKHHKDINIIYFINNTYSLCLIFVFLIQKMYTFLYADLYIAHDLICVLNLRIISYTQLVGKRWPIVWKVIPSTNQSTRKIPQICPLHNGSSPSVAVLHFYLMVKDVFTYIFSQKNRG